MPPFQFDVCIPVYRNLRCFDLAIRGWRRRISDPKSIRKFLLHIQDPSEMDAAMAVMASYKFDAEVASVGSGVVNMVHPMNALFAACVSPWVVFTEQDVFLSHSPDSLVTHIKDYGFVVAGPVDTFFYDNINARKMPHYGQYGRLSGEPGHYHSSFIVMNREAVAAKSKTPFSLPDGYLMHGTGCLGGELYYGLRVNVEESRTQLGFFRQTHGDYGYSAVLSHQGKPFATHMYYSSRQTICATPATDLLAQEVEWIKSEEQRFLRDYEQNLDPSR